MPTFKVKVELTCKSCAGKFYSTIPDEFHIQPQVPNVRPITITIEELQGNVHKEITDNSGNVVGDIDMKDFEFSIGHPRCGNNNQYTVSDCTFVAS